MQGPEVSSSEHHRQQDQGTQADFTADVTVTCSHRNTTLAILANISSIKNT